MRVMMMIKGDREPGHLPSGGVPGPDGRVQRGAVEGRRAAGPGRAALERRGRSGQVLPRHAYRDRRPFGEAKAIVAGYWILQVKSMDEAIEWAKRLPFEAGGEPEAEGEIEIRQLFELDEFGESPAVERGR